MKMTLIALSLLILSIGESPASKIGQLKVQPAAALSNRGVDEHVSHALSYTRTMNIKHVLSQS